VVFGPVQRAGAGDGDRVHRDYLERFFSREGPMPPPVRCRAISAAATACCAGRPCRTRSSRSTSAATSIGGEDDLLFGTMEAAGATFVWAPDAWVWEDPIPDRLTLRYTLAARLRLRPGAQRALRRLDAA
jgi:succinoglycan biosynthesis protein ExoM